MSATTETSVPVTTRDEHLSVAHIVATPICDVGVAGNGPNAVHHVGLRSTLGLTRDLLILVACFLECEEYGRFAVVDQTSWAILREDVDLKRPHWVVSTAGWLPESRLMIRRVRQLVATVGVFGALRITAKECVSRGGKSLEVEGNLVRHIVHGRVEQPYREWTELCVGSFPFRYRNALLHRTASEEDDASTSVDLGRFILTELRTVNLELLSSSSLETEPCRKRVLKQLATLRRLSTDEGNLLLMQQLQYFPPDHARNTIPWPDEIRSAVGAWQKRARR